MTMRIMLVDDDPNVLNGYRRMLYSMRGEWEMHFAASGAEALEVLEGAQFDVIVSDMRMPGMDGAQLLGEVKQRHPDTIRFVLSGYSDREMVIKSLGSTHQYLAKPCDSATLKNALGRALSLRRLLTDEHLKRLVSRLDNIPCLPNIYNEILSELKSPDSSIAIIGEIIATDAGMTAKILQIVNSAFFGLPRKISNPSQAVSLLGLDTIRALVLSTHVFSVFEGNLISERWYESLWHHSIAVSSTAKKIAILEGAGTDMVDEAVIAGLLHDAGKLVLAGNAPEEYGEAVKRAESDMIPLYDAEKLVFGAGHAEAGAYLLGLWGLPNAIVEAVAYHHKPSSSEHQEFSPLTAVHAADFIDRQVRGDWTGTVEGPLDEDYLGTLNLKNRMKHWKRECKALLVSEEA